MTKLRIIFSVTFDTYNGIIIFDINHIPYIFSIFFFFYYNYVNAYIHLIDLNHIIKGKKLYVKFDDFDFYAFFNFVCIEYLLLNRIFIRK